MYKISPSKLEQYRLYMADAPYVSLEDLQQSIVGTQEEKFAMSYGSAVHKYLETGELLKDANDNQYLHKDEISFLEPYKEKFSNWQKEQWFTYQISPEVEIRMRVDGLLGYNLHEIKTTKYFRGLDSYENSIQWKIYLLASEAEFADYHIFEYRGMSQPHKLIYTNFRLYPYENMKTEIKNLTEGFLLFCKEKDLTKYITINQ